MSQIISRPWYSVLVLALALSTVHSHPIKDTEATNLEARSPRLIPDTANYVHEVLTNLGLDSLVPSSTTTSTPSATPTPTPTKSEEPNEKEEKEPEIPDPKIPDPEIPEPEDNYHVYKQPTPTTHITYESSTSYTPTYGSNGAGYTETVKHENSHDPVNIEIMSGWNKDRKLTAGDLPVVFDAVYRELKHRIGNMVDSSDEVGLDGFMGNMESY